MSKPQDYMSDWIGGKLAAGKAVSVLNTSMIVNNLKDRAYKLLGIHYQIALTKGQSACISIGIYGPDNSNFMIGNTPPILVGQVPRTVSLKTPSGTDWFPNDNTTAINVHTLSVLECINQGNDDYEVRWVARLDFQIGPEFFNQTQSTRHLSMDTV